MNGGVGGVARSFEITNCAGSSPCATMARSSSGSLRLNSAESPPTVDCRIIATADRLSLSNAPAKQPGPCLVGRQRTQVQRRGRAAGLRLLRGVDFQYKSDSGSAGQGRDIDRG